MRTWHICASNLREQSGTSLAGKDGRVHPHGPYETSSERTNIDDKKSLRSYCGVGLGFDVHAGDLIDDKKSLRSYCGRSAPVSIGL
jgi:hypothetical protein